MAEAFRIDRVQHAFLAASYNQVRAWNQDSSRGVQVIVILIQLKVIGGSKPVQQMHVRIEFDKALAELRGAVPTAVSGDEVNVALTIHGRRLAGLPDARFRSAGGSIEDANLLQRSIVVTQ